ncbi:helix-turn-helix domain-containing protein [Kitasatospora sp. NPDC086801]|uniref:helix-turn-helix domain-containing protein n=1 Tax=Kitasatospora sp. NPDC086801 TaxID=3364066 RepID=UPI00382FCF94
MIALCHHSITIRCSTLAWAVPTVFAGRLGHFAAMVRPVPDVLRRWNMNHGLRRALASAKMTEAQLAEACGVDAKTVSRWIADPGRTPHARHRWAACRALGEEEVALWPTTARLTLRTGP